MRGALITSCGPKLAPNLAYERLRTRCGMQQGYRRPQQPAQAVKAGASAQAHLFSKVFGELHVTELLEDGAEELSLQPAAEAAQAGGAGIMVSDRRLYSRLCCAQPPRIGGC
jgi:hypothetical protein